VSVLVEDTSRSKCFSLAPISHVLRFISICDLFTGSPSHVPVSYGGGRLSPLGTSATVWPIVPAMDDR
jgi:hypothetical protein